MGLKFAIPISKISIEIVVVNMESTVFMRARRSECYNEISSAIAEFIRTFKSVKHSKKNGQVIKQVKTKK